MLRAVAEEAGCSPSQAIIAWMRQSDPAILPIIAGSKFEQLQENIAALDITLSSDQMSRLDAAGNPGVKRDDSANITGVMTLNRLRKVSGTT